VRKALKSDIVKRCLNARRYFREVDYFLPGKSGMRIGAIDLLIEEKDGLVIVDYKTDGVKPDEIERKMEEAKYREQARNYMNALVSRGLKVKEIVYYFVVPDECEVLCPEFLVS
ncbi:MAG: PD-(D/E)XK nuclease family protein, partial [Vulcanimicrobiota bacterium]